MQVVRSGATWLTLALLSLPAGADPEQRADTNPAASESAPKVQVVREITIDPNAKPPVCRRYVPTGSRIASQRCTAAPDRSSTQAQQADRDIARRDVDELRSLQALREQLRAQAQAEALRRRTSGQ